MTEEQKLLLENWEKVFCENFCGRIFEHLDNEYSPECRLMPEEPKKPFEEIRPWIQKLLAAQRAKDAEIVYKNHVCLVELNKCEIVYKILNQNNL